MNSIPSIARRHRSFVSVFVAAAAIVSSVTMTAACGTDSAAPATPAVVPADDRIYPPTDVPVVRPGVTDSGASARMAQNEKKFIHAGARPGVM